MAQFGIQIGLLVDVEDLAATEAVVEQVTSDLSAYGSVDYLDVIDIEAANAQVRQMLESMGVEFDEDGNPTEESLAAVQGGAPTEDEDGPAV